MPMPKADDDQAGAVLTDALDKYRRSYEEKVRNAPNEEGQRAKALVQRARAIVGQSGLSRALVNVLLEEVRCWPAWSTRSDFRKWCHFDASDVVATKKDLGRSKHETRVAFSYKGPRYEVAFFDEGWSNYGEAFHHGRVEFHSDQLVLGLNISDDMDPDCPQWRDFDLYAFRVGEWTKALLEIAADIEANRANKQQAAQSTKAIEQARLIEF